MGRRRRNAYWTIAGGQVTVEEVTRQHHQQEEEEEAAPSVVSPSVEEPACNTRRSLRQQAKKAAQTIHNIQQEEELVDIECSEDEDYSRFTPLTTAASRKKRFLKDARTVGRPPTAAARKATAAPETTAHALNRLLGKRSNKPRYVVKHGRFNVQRGRGRPAGGGNRHHLPPPPPLIPHPSNRSSVQAAQQIRIPEPEASFGSGSLPLKVEIQEGDHSSMVMPSVEGPRKRGRKRKVDMPVNLSMKNEAGELLVKPPTSYRKEKRQAPVQDPDWDPTESIEQQQQRKRGRQSAATATVKNRFPFCTLCLSKNPPSDYIINHMSCPSEYQRMKRLFAYIYKDLRFPFMPFDMERDNVFDYCDLPLCDCCIQLYREIYDCYAQIETARDHLKSKIERMVYQIQLSEQNPAVSQQLTSIKNSPDALMNKYCNFRRRFATYKPGDSRGDMDSGNLVPATIARIRVINQTPKRTTGCQTFLTAGHFPAKESTPAAATTTPTAGTSTSGSSGSSSVIGGVTIKKEIESPPPSSSSSKPHTTSKADTGSSSKVSKDQTSHKQLPKTQSSSSTIASAKPVVTAPVVNSKPTAPTTKPVKSAVTAPVVTSKPAAATPKPVLAPHASALTIVKTPGGGGPAIIRKIPPKPAISIISQHSRLLAIATPTHKRPNSATTPGAGKSSVNGSTGNDPKLAKEAPAVVVKDEPVDPEEVQIPTEEESDPFFNGDSTEPMAASECATEKNTGEGENDTEKDGNSEQINTNVFHKHKKLRVLPVPSYKDSSNDSSDGATISEPSTAANAKEQKENESGNDSITNDKTDEPQLEKSKDDADESKLTEESKDTGETEDPDETKDDSSTAEPVEENE